jgi:hypothetical protein
MRWGGGGSRSSTSSSQNPDCAGTTGCPLTCAANKPCTVECRMGEVCALTYVSGNSCYYGISSCCACFESSTCGICDLGYGYCSYASVTTTNQTSCPAPCTYVGTVPMLSKMVPDGSTANKCDKDNGWQCDYTVTAGVLRGRGLRGADVRWNN